MKFNSDRFLNLLYAAVFSYTAISLTVKFAIDRSKFGGINEWLIYFMAVGSFMLAISGIKKYFKS